MRELKMKLQDMDDLSQIMLYWEYAAALEEDEEITFQEWYAMMIEAGF
jgi:hypothetical protein